jgi:hypothetical protein
VLLYNRRLVFANKRLVGVYNRRLLQIYDMPIRYQDFK